MRRFSFYAAWCCTLLIWVQSKTLAQPIIIGGVVGQVNYELYDGNDVLRETATVNNNTLDILSGGVLYRYTRTRQFDTRQSFGYYNTTHDKIIRWPLTNRGFLRVGERTLTGGYAFRNGYHIGHRGGPIGPPPGQRPRSRRRVVVIESALPGGGLVTAGFGRGGNVEIGDANPNVTRNQFYLRYESGDYFSLTPVADQDMVVDVPEGRADSGTNIHVYDVRDIDPPDMQFRLRSAARGFSYIETRLRRGFVWTVDGTRAVQGSNIRLQRQNQQQSQMFRISRPQDVGRLASAPGGRADILPPAGRSSRPVEIKLANSQASEVWALLVDRRRPHEPQRIKIPPNDYITVQIADGGGTSQLFYEVSVYRLQRQSVVIDATQPGPGVVTEENYSPKSIGWFEIPFEKQEQGGTMDVYRRATRSHNPGRVARIDPQLWRDLPPPPQGGIRPDQPKSPDPFEAHVGSSTKAPDQGPFGTAPPTPSPRRSSALAAYLTQESSDRVTPDGFLPLCVAQSDGDHIQVEQLYWETQAVTYAVEVPITKTRQTPAGKTEQYTELQQETRTREQPLLSTMTQRLPLDQVEAYLANGSQVDRVAIRQQLRTEAPALILQTEFGERLDPRYLPLLRPETLILISSALPSEPTSNLTTARRKQLPTTPVTIHGIKRALSGGVAKLVTYPEQTEQAYTVTVTVDVEQVVDGRTITVQKQVPETRTRTVNVWKTREQILPPGSFRLYQMSGKKLTGPLPQLTKPQPAVVVAQGAVIDPWYRKLLRPETIVVMERKR